MCLNIRLEPTGDPEGRLRAASESDETRSLGWRLEGRSRLGRHAPRLSLHACDFLADDADWDAATWSMVPAAASQLADSIEALLDEIGGSVAIEALWDGEKSITKEPIERDRFVELVRRSALGTHVSYLVSHGRLS